MSEFKGTIELIGGITPKNNGDFPLVTSKDVELPTGVRLSDIFVKADDATERAFLTGTFTTRTVGSQYVYTNTDFSDALLLSLWFSKWTRAIVHYDGQTYRCEPKGTYGEKAIGNGALCNGSIPESTDPFALIVLDVGTFVLFCSEPGDHSLSITLEYADRYVIDESYAPRAYELVAGDLFIDPDKYYVFGEVDELSIELNSVADNKVHEYIFEFVPSANFTTLTIDPEPKWVNEIQIVPGKTHQVSIVRGIGVMVCA